MLYHFYPFTPFPALFPGGRTYKAPARCPSGGAEHRGGRAGLGEPPRSLPGRAGQQQLLQQHGRLGFRFRNYESTSNASPPAPAPRALAMPRRASPHERGVCVLLRTGEAPDAAGGGAVPGQALDVWGHGSGLHRPADRSAEKAGSLFILFLSMRDLRGAAAGPASLSVPG